MQYWEELGKGDVERGQAPLRQSGTLPSSQLHGPSRCLTVSQWLSGEAAGFYQRKTEAVRNLEDRASALPCCPGKEERKQRHHSEGGWRENSARGKVENDALPGGRRDQVRALLHTDALARLHALDTHTHAPTRTRSLCIYLLPSLPVVNMFGEEILHTTV